MILRCVTGLLCCCLSAGAGWAAFEESRKPSPTVPTFAQIGPYGEPLRLEPAHHPLGDEMQGVGLRGPSGLVAPTTADADRAGNLRDRIAHPHRPGEPEDDEDLPDRPGTFGRQFVTVPVPVPDLKPRPGFGPHLKPDTEINLSRSTSLGLFGDVSNADTARQDSSARSDSRGLNLPGLKNKELGAGVSLQYRFGQ